MRDSDDLILTCEKLDLKIPSKLHINLPMDWNGYPVISFDETRYAVLVPKELLNNFIKRSMNIDKDIEVIYANIQNR